MPGGAGETCFSVAPAGASAFRSLNIPRFHRGLLSDAIPSLNQNTDFENTPWSFSLNALTIQASADDSHELIRKKRLLQKVFTGL
jgi:hypothetical protein